MIAQIKRSQIFPGIIDLCKLYRFEHFNVTSLLLLKKIKCRDSVTVNSCNLSVADMKQGIPVLLNE